MPSPRQARRCTANRSGNRGPCGAWAMSGAVVCRAHGGRAPQVIAAAKERQLDAQVRQTLARLDVDEVADPLTELGRLAGQVLAWKNALAERVNDLIALRYTAAGAGTEQLRAEVALFERAMDRCVLVLGAMARLNIDSRLTAISEAQADMLIRAVNAGLAAAGVHGPAAADARKAIGRELRLVNRGA